MTQPHAQGEQRQAETEGWRPIETAPKDGTPVLLFLNPALDTNYLCGWIPQKHLTIVVGWAEGYGEYTDGSYLEWKCGFCEDGSADTEGFSSPIPTTVYPSRWMPLPAPPTDGASI